MTDENTPSTDDSRPAVGGPVERMVRPLADDDWKFIFSVLEGTKLDTPRIRECVARLQVGHDRYEVARRMNPAQWRDAWLLNIKTGKPFDEIVDDLRPFLCPNV
jgi:hypothetical protein